MSDGGNKIRNKECIHFIIFAVVEWVDVFTRKECRFIENGISVKWKVLSCKLRTAFVDSLNI
ncbi:MAG: hypothetical protein LC128_04585 [Chitinophagales bacterium]|nr:hypothetical protein [Chitinophagales bacterium]MCZ2458884.1 hypothetical protein [Chitinophagales bacterium]